MGHVRTMSHVDVAPDQAFEFGAKAERLPEWSASLVEVKDVSGPADRVGASYTAVMKLGGRKLEGRWAVTRVEKPRLVELNGTAPGGGTATLITRYAPAAGGTDITTELDYELPGGFVGGLADKLFVERAIERDFKHSSENFKAIVEAEVPVHA